MIKTTQLNASKAYNHIDVIYKQPVSIQTAKQLFTLKKKLQECYEFQTEQEMNIINKYNGQLSGQNSVNFGNNDNAQKAAEELEALQNLEVEVDMEPIELPSQNLQLSGEDFEALEPFIKLKE